MADHNSKLNGCAWIVGAVVLGTMIGRCSAAPEPSDEWSSGSELVDVQDAEPLETAYVSANGLNCRSRGALRSPVVSKLEQGEELQVQARLDGWAQVKSEEGDCWVATRYLSETKPRPIKAIERPQMLASPRRISPAANEGWSCSYRPYCTQISSCAEANYYYRQCGISRLDGDNDGIPCERVR